MFLLSYNWEHRLWGIVISNVNKGAPNKQQLWNYAVEVKKQTKITMTHDSWR